jgi:hypothetical protein
MPFANASCVQWIPDQVRDDRQSESGMTAKAILGRQKLQIRPDIFKFPWGGSITLRRSAIVRVDVAFFNGLRPTLFQPRYTARDSLLKMFNPCCAAPLRSR